MHLGFLILPAFEFISPPVSTVPVLYLLSVCELIFTISHQLKYFHNSMVQEPCNRKWNLQIVFHCITKFIWVFHLLILHSALTQSGHQVVSHASEKVQKLCFFLII